MGLARREPGHVGVAAPSPGADDQPSDAHRACEAASEHRRRRPRVRDVRAAVGDHRRSSKRDARSPLPDVDLERSVLTISRGRWSGPTDSSRRTRRRTQVRRVALTRLTVDALQAHRSAADERATRFAGHVDATPSSSPATSPAVSRGSPTRHRVDSVRPAAGSSYRACGCTTSATTSPLGYDGGGGCQDRVRTTRTPERGDDLERLRPLCPRDRPRGRRGLAA